MRHVKGKGLWTTLFSKQHLTRILTKKAKLVFLTQGSKKALHILKLQTKPKNNSIEKDS